MRPLLGLLQVRVGDPKGTEWYGYWCLAVLFLVYISDQFDKQLLYYLNVPLRGDVQLTSAEYGFLAGWGSTIPTVICYLPVAFVADRFHARLLVIFIGICTWSMMTAYHGLCNTFWQLLLCRIGIGLADSACVPPSLSLLSDLFPPHRRVLVFSLYQFGVYLGGGLASGIGGYLSDLYGWRVAFFVLGLSGLFLALLLGLTVEDPPQGLYDSPSHSSSDPHLSDSTPLLFDDDDLQNPIMQQEDFPSTAATATATATSSSSSSSSTIPSSTGTITMVWHYFLASRTAALLSLAAGVRAFGGYTFGAYVPAFFMGAYGKTPGELGSYYGPIVMLFGSSSSFLGGFLSSLWQAKGREDAAALVCMIGSVASIPCVALMLYMPQIVGSSDELSFALSLAFLAAAYLTAECWMGPASAIGINIYPNAIKTSVTAVFNLSLALLGSLGPVLVGFVYDATPSSAHPSVLFASIALSYGFSAVLFWAISRTMLDELSSKR